mmetsp:Transcript_16308/g.37734  ORF Transcript_16308/g.37734 Transcript_16308/m.37734 type:complete len:1075 (-) Transcript_16308:287-3511(-)
MMRNGTSTQTSILSPSAIDLTKSRNADQHAHSQSVDVKRNGQHCEALNGNEPQNNATDVTNVAGTNLPSIRSSVLSFLEFIVVTIYKCLGIGIHSGLAIAFLAFVAVTILGNFHDRYWVTLLDRARRTDVDLLSEITYYQRRCDITDITTSDSHRIHFGDVDDNPSEIFIDVEKIKNELEGYPEPSSVLYDDRGFRTKYQENARERRRRRFAPAYNRWEYPELEPIPEKIAEKAGNQAVDVMMKHGSVMIPQMLSDATIGELRKFIEEKNEKTIGTDDEYPMTAHKSRISYGIESTEHPSVVRALKEIHDHRVFAHLIKNLVGDENPALSEITAITAWDGAEDQSWHPDVKPDGNGVKFGRTYSHSYSLFLPLQNTDGDMGPTDVCPGTHMCATEDLWDPCLENKVGFHEVRKAKPRNEYSLDEDGEHKYREDLRMEGIWRAGDGALLNQQGWHRGTAHNAPEDRIVFIVSFLKRPHPDDPRQLARGTYFHQKWLNWGSTWDDMVDTMANLQRPWNILRCLHLYKPTDRSWGYDLFTATTLRIANGQMGGEPEEIDTLIENVIVPVRFPDWLQGTIDYDDENAWVMYMKGTITKTLNFLGRVNLYGHAGLVTFLAIAAILGYLYNLLLTKATGNVRSQHNVVGPVIKTGVKRLIVTHGSIIALGFFVWQILICSSQWAIDIDSGKTLMRPFPTKPIYRDDDPGVLGEHSTLPRRSDVLIGTRMNTKAIGAYSTWFEYHPGNRVFDQFVERYGGTKGVYHSFLPQNRHNQTSSQLPTGLAERLVASAFDMITKHHGGGRFVMQDYRSGDWMILSEAESHDYIRKRLFIGGKTANALGAIRDELNVLIDHQRFGSPRNSISMSWNSQLFLHDLSKEIFSTNYERETRKKRKPNQTRIGPSTPGVSSSPSNMLPRAGYRVSKWESIGPTVSSAEDENGIRRFLLGDSPPSFRPGMEIYFLYDDKNEDQNDPELYKGTIVSYSSKKRFRDGHPRYLIAMEEEGVEDLDIEIPKVPRSFIKVRSPISSGARVEAQLHPDEEYYKGTILLIMADGSIDVQFDDGDIELSIHMDHYELLED